MSRSPRFPKKLLLWLFVGSLPVWFQFGTLVLHADQRSAAQSNSGTTDRKETPKYQPDKILVRFRPGVSRRAMEAAHAAMRSQVLSEPAAVDRLQIVQLATGMTVEQAVSQYRADPNVLYAEPDFIVQATGIPNDPLFSSQWNLQNTGQNGGTVGADVHAPAAWDITTGSSGVVIAVIDTGVDYTHPDLSSNVWTASSGFSVTDINGTTVQCPIGVHGFNAVANTCDPLDDNGHGTHVSGILGAIGNNGTGIAGLNWNAQILPCKFLDANGSGDIGGAVTCLSFLKVLKDGGLNIVVSNNSWGNNSFSQALQDAIASQMSDGILFVAAAGNDFSDNDVFPFYPANIPLPNVISVAATTRTDDLAGFSNLGRHTVHIGAPGLEILSTLPNSSYGTLSGTSMAAPHVTGVAALLKAQDPSRDWRAIKNLILAGGDTISSLQGTITQKRLNAAGALTCSNSAVQSRLQPIPDTISGSVGTPITLAFLNINCANPAGTVTVQVSPGNQTITLTDDGTNPDQAANDGIYTAQWTPVAQGNYSLQFPDGSVVAVEVLSSYKFSLTTFSYRTITGTDLDLGDDSVAQVSSPFPIQFGGGSFNQLFVSSNGTVSFTDNFDGYLNFGLGFPGFPVSLFHPTTLVAPYWADLFPIKGTAQNVYWDVVGTAPSRELVVEWRNVRAFACRYVSNETITFQVVFKEGSSDILFNYSSPVFSGPCTFPTPAQPPTIGVQTSVSDGVMFSPNMPAVSTAILWQTVPVSSPNPAPAVTSISPSTGIANGPDTALIVSGTGFVPGSTVLWNNTMLATTFVNSAQLSAMIPASFFASNSGTSSPDAATITVDSPGPGGGASNGLSFKIIPDSGAPFINSMFPASANAGGFGFWLTINGNHLAGSHLLWNGQELQSFAVSDNELRVQISSNLIATPGAAQIMAMNPASGGPSKPVSFVISNASAQSPGKGPLRIPVRAAVNADGSTQGPSLNALRFLGWNYGRTQGTAYLNHFSRRYGGVALRPANQAQATVAGRTNFATSSAINLTQPQTLPGFGFHPTLPAGYLPTSVATGDFNQDGKLDWVVSNGGSNDLWIYFGNGDGTSQLPAIVPLTGATPLQVIAADLRHNGTLDLVVAEVDSQTIGVLLGNGDGTFKPEITLFVPAPPLSIAVADVNGDGKLDIVAGLLGDEFTGPVATFLGDGAGNFGRAITQDTDVIVGSFATTTVVAVDLNSDGNADLLVVDQGGVIDGAHSYLSRGDGTFKHADYFLEDGFSTFVTNISFGDMDEDGCPDAVTVEALGLVRIFKGTCDGNFDEVPLLTTVGAGEAPVSVAVADMNGDGHLDVVTSGGFFIIDVPAQQAGNLVTVLSGDGKGNLGSPKVYRGEPSLFGLAVGDLNEDGHPDVIVSSQDSDTAAVFLNDGSGGFSGPSGEYIGYITNGQGGTTNAPFTDFFAVDIDGDGKTDLALIEQQQFFQQPWNLAVVLNDGTGHFGPVVRSPVIDGSHIPIAYVMGDFRNTGRPDFLAFHFDDSNDNGQSVSFCPNAGGGQFGAPVVTPLSSDFGIFGVLGTGDFNHDGNLDYVLATETPSTSPLFAAGLYEMTVFYGNGNGTFRQGPSQAFGANQGFFVGSPRMIFTGDFNKDGNLDVLIWVYDNVEGTQHHNVYEFLGNSDGTFQPARLILPDFGFFGMADLNHDGLPDIVEYKQPLTTLADSLPVAFNIYLGQPDGSFKLTQTYQPYAGLSSFDFTFDNGSPQQSFSPMIADFNGDGNADIAVFQKPTSIPADSYFQILLGNGDGTFTPSYAINRLDKFQVPSTAADVTGDGRADLIEVDSWPSSFHVIPAVPGRALQLSLLAQPVVGAHGTLTVGLNVVSSSDTVVQLSATDPNISIASSATVTAGSVSVNVPFTISNSFDASRIFGLTAQLGAEQDTVYSFKTSSALAGFNMTSSFPQEMSPPGGVTPSYDVTLVSFGGYSSTAQLSCQGLPAGASCQTTPNPLPVLPGEPAGASLTVQVNSAVPLGSYPFSVIATDGSVTQQIPLMLIVADFNVSLSPPSVNVAKGNVANFSLTIGSLGAWNSTVIMNCQIAPSGAIPCFDNSPIVPGTYQQAFLTSQASVGDYTISISGTADGVTHAAPPVVLHVQGATGAVSSSSATIAVGSSAVFNLSLNSQNGLTDQFTFSCTGLVPGVSCGFNPVSGTLPPNGTLAGALTISVSSKPVTATPALTGNKKRPLLPLLPLVAVGLLLVWGIALASSGFQRRRNRISVALPAALAVVLVFSLIACGGGGGGGSGSTQPPPPPPPPPTKPSIVVLSVQASSKNLTVPLGTITVTIP